MNYFSKFSLILLFFILSTGLYSQVNAFARITGVIGNSLSLSTVDETFDSFEDGDEVFIFQVQRGVGAYASSNVSYSGNMSSVSSAGKMEVATILSHTETAGIPATITLSAGLSNSYSTASNARLQVVTFPTLGTGNYTSTANITTIPWDGEIGGVIAFNVIDTLDLHHNIDASGMGFRGGSPTPVNNYTYCYSSAAFSNSNYGGQKGEGLQLYAPSQFGRGHWVNGGGGGNRKWGAGGGGSNFLFGGAGSSLSCSSSSGVGGESLWSVYSFSSNINNARMFFGGGGGGGHHNNAGLTGSGGNGGGFIYIKATAIRTTGTCSGLFIRSDGTNGGSIYGPGFGGAGGGGAGGAIYIWTQAYLLDVNCALNVSCNGGLGGSCADTTGGGMLSAGCGGGGGGQGAACNANASATNSSAVNASTSVGAGGTGDANGADSGGSSNSGTVGFGTGGGLPIDLLFFNAELNRNVVDLRWATASELNNERFLIYRSTDAIEWQEISSIQGALNSSQTIFYETTDETPPSGLVYYRLEQIDTDGQNSFSEIVSVLVKISPQFFVVHDLQERMYRLSGKGLTGSVVSFINMNGMVLRQHMATDDIDYLAAPSLAKGHLLIKIQLMDGSIHFIRPSLKL